MPYGLFDFADSIPSRKEETETGHTPESTWEVARIDSVTTSAAWSMRSTTRQFLAVVKMDASVLGKAELKGAQIRRRLGL